MKKVLITLDYDPTSQRVAERGFKMAKAMHAEIILLHVLSNPVLYYPEHALMVPLQVHNMEELKAVAQQFLDKTKLDFGDKTIRTLIVEGDTAEQILESAKKTKADIIVIGTHSQKWLENILMGSVAEKVLKDTTLPLFIIPTKKTDE